MGLSEQYDVSNEFWQAAAGIMIALAGLARRGALS
jgi:hypothetical protein